MLFGLLLEGKHERDIFKAFFSSPFGRLEVVKPSNFLIEVVKQAL